jgi:hypothetical protein
VATALDAIESGRLSVEEILLGGAARSQRFRSFLHQHVQNAVNLPAGNAVIRSPVRSLDEVRALLKEAERFKVDPNIVHVTWGRKTISGRAAPVDGVIFIVREKRAASSDSNLTVPSVLTVTRGDRTISAVTDVRQMSVGAKHAGLVQPGFQCAVVAGSSAGTLSCVVTMNGPHAIISGHVAKTVGIAVTGTTVSGAKVALGKATTVIDNRDIDAALVGPIQCNVSDIAALSSTELRDLRANETGVVVRIGRRTGDVFPSVEVPSEPVTFLDPLTGAESPMNALIRLNAEATVHGDSGAPAFDMDNNLIGFVEGVANHRTYLIPARRAIDGVS